MIKSAKGIIQKTFRSMGYEVVKLPSKEFEKDIVHEEIRPSTTYSPWNSDEAFRENYQKIKNNTLVDIYRCWELWMLVGQIAHLEGAILEVGVWRGGTGSLLAKKAQLCGIPDPVYLCDTFNGVVKAGPRDNVYEGGEHADTSRKIVENLTRHLELSNVQILEGIFPEETGHIIEKNKFRLCHIDVDVYQGTKDIAEWVWPRLVSGGIVIYDDFGEKTTAGITSYVNEQIVMKGRLVIYNINGHAIVIKTLPPERSFDGSKN